MATRPTPKRKRCRVPRCKGVEDCIFSMPTKSPAVRSQWLHNLGMENKGPTYRVYVCDEHFCKHDFALGVKSHPEGRNLHLLPGAVPHLKIDGANFHCFLDAVAPSKDIIVPNEYHSTAADLTPKCLMRDEKTTTFD